MLTRIREVLNGIGGILAVPVLFAGIAGGAALFLYEAYIWNRTGTWELHTIVTLLQMGGDAWALNPRDWIGLHKLLSFIPLFLVLPAAFGLLAAGLRQDAEGQNAGLVKSQK